MCLCLRLYKFGILPNAAVHTKKAILVSALFFHMLFQGKEKQQGAWRMIEHAERYMPISSVQHDRVQEGEERG
jgi:hypothetical protein